MWSGGNFTHIAHIVKLSIKMTNKLQASYLQTSADQLMKPKPSFKRYIVLFLFCFNSGNKAFQWIQIPAATTKLTYFYDINNLVINAASVIFMVTFVFISLPACFVIKWMGIRKALLLSSFAAALGSIIKCFSSHEGGIYALFIGQLVVSLGEQLIFSVPSRLVAVWFPDHQVSSALAATFVGNQLGVAIGFFVPQYILSTATTKLEIGAGMDLLFRWTAIISVVALVVDIILFDEAPKYPPGTARWKQIIEEEKNDSSSSIKSEARIIGRQSLQLLSNRDYRLLTLYYGINVGIIYTVSTLLNQTLEFSWPGDDIIVGNTGFLIIVGGCLSALFWGQLMDKMHLYLLLNKLTSILGLLALVLLGYFSYRKHAVYLVYVTSAVMGVFQCGVTICGLELAVELTYPMPELLTSTLMNLSPQIFGTIFIFLGSYIVDTHGVVAIYLFYTIILIFDLLLLFCVNETLKRQKATVEETKQVKQVALNKELEQVF